MSVDKGDNDLEGLDPSQFGGMTTGEWGIKAYGNMGQQTAIPGTNVIQVHGGTGTNLPVVGMKPMNGGLPSLSEVMVPVLLTIASNKIPKYLRKTLKLKKSKGGSSVSIPGAVLLSDANMTVNRVGGGKKRKSVSKKSHNRKYRRTTRSSSRR
jgi:hypothetical protein